MKKTIILSMLTVGLAASGFAQGFFTVDNSADYDGTANAFLPFIGAQNAGVGEGATGSIIGSGSAPNYDMAILVMAGTANTGDSISPTAFMGLGATFIPETFSYLAGTGDFVDGAGLVAAGPVTPYATGAPDGTLITIQLVSWYDPTGTTSYATALADGFNTGGSVLNTIRLSAGADPVSADLSQIQGYAVTTPVPEPATLALVGLGGLASLVAFRRKQA